MVRLNVAILLLFWALSSQAEDTVVFEGYPLSRVSSDADMTEREELNPAQIKEFRVLIVKRDDKYFWASRENKELIYVTSGAAHWFIAPSSGYIKIIDLQILDPEADKGPLVYVEHLGLFDYMITYWGIGDGPGL